MAGKQKPKHLGNIIGFSANAVLNSDSLNRNMTFTKAEEIKWKAPYSDGRKTFAMYGYRRKYRG